MRFAPNPSGPLHIGHARAAILNYSMAKENNGKLILRIEDTDPKRVEKSAYRMIEEDLKWLGIKWNNRIVQSERLKIYFEHIRKAIEMKVAYACTCNKDLFAEYKRDCRACPHRDRDVEESLEIFNRMVRGELEEGMAVIRFKTRMEEQNPALRDFVIARVVEYEHPNVKSNVWPTMNFSVAVDDHLLGVTHVLRGKDHISNTEKQRYIYRAMRWKEPEFIHYGMLKVSGAVLKTSKIKEGIEKGIFDGWSDPRLGTIRALKRRGITAEAIKKVLLSMGITEVDSTFSWENLYAENRKIVDRQTPRFFFVRNPVELSVEGVEERFEVYIRNHPDIPEMGKRKVVFEPENGKIKVVVPQSIKDGIYRLIEGFNIEIVRNSARFLSIDFKSSKRVKAKRIEWVTPENINIEILMTDGSRVRGVTEKEVINMIGKRVQFVKFGFVMVEAIEDGMLKAVYSHR